jgi:hypothetical protein
MIPLKLLCILIECLAVVESGDNPDAVSRDHDHRGALQIGTAMREDLNRLAGREKWKSGDELNPAKSRVMAIEYFEEYAEDYMTPYALALFWKKGPTGMHRDLTLADEGYAERVARMVKEKIEDGEK